MFRSIFSRMTGSKSKDAKGESEDDSSSSSSSSSSDSSSDSDDSDNDDNSNKGDALPVIPSFVFDKTHLMGAAGFPLDITAMYYHSASQVLCVGTMHFPNCSNPNPNPNPNPNSNGGCYSCHIN